MTKIPDSAKCVFKGVLFDIYQWEQEMFNGTTQTFEAIKRLGSSQIIAVTKNKKIMMLKEQQPYIGEFLSIPGGQIETGETPIDNAKKEMLEELGMVSNDIDLWKEVGFSTKINWPSYYFIARNCKKIQDTNFEQAGEKIVAYELTFDEFIDEVKKDKFRNKMFQLMIYEILEDEVKLNLFKELLFR